MHSYISKDSLIPLANKNRTAIVINNVCTCDIDEYINTVLAVLQNQNFDTSKLNQPKIFKEQGIYTIVLILRQGKSLNDSERQALDEWCQLMGNAYELKQYLRMIVGIK